MSAEVAVVGRLFDEAAVAALVGGRVYQLVLPPGGTLPAIRVQLIDDQQTKHLRGPNGLTAARVQVDAFDKEASGADPYVSVSNVAEAVNDALVFEPFAVGSIRVQCATRVDKRAMHEADELNQVRILQDFIVWSKVMT